MVLTATLSVSALDPKFQNFARAQRDPVCHAQRRQNFAPLDLELSRAQRGAKLTLGARPETCIIMQISVLAETTPKVHIPTLQQVTIHAKIMFQSIASHTLV